MTTIKYAKLVKAKRQEVSRQALAKATDIYGYGTKIPIDFKVQIKSSKRWLRVYMVFTSNSPTYYVSTKDCKFIVVEYKEIVDKVVLQHRYDYWNIFDKK